MSTEACMAAEVMTGQLTFTASDRRCLPSVPWLKPKMALRALSYVRSPWAMEVAASTCGQ